MLATCWLRSHTQGPPLIFHSEEEREAYIILTEPEWRETSLCYLHTHTHCQRFIVQGFNGGPTHLSPSLSLYTSLLARTDTNTHPSIIQSLLPLFSSSSPWFHYQLSISHLPLLLISLFHLSSIFPFLPHFSSSSSSLRRQPPVSLFLRSVN